MIDHDKVEVVSIMLLHASSGLSLGMSVVVLADVLPWRWPHRHPWVVALVLTGLWAPFVFSGNAEIRRAGATAVSLYLAGLFLAYERYIASYQVSCVAQARARALEAAVAAVEQDGRTCPVRRRGDCALTKLPLDE